MRLTYGALDLTDYPYLIEFGLDAGAPQNVTEALAFLLQDGEIELSSRASNRTIQFNVLIEGADLAELADHEKALILETEKPLNLLTIDPDDGFGVPTVYETFRAQVSLVRDDDMEMAAIRRYSVTVRAYPFVRSEDEVVATAIPAPPAVPTVTNIDNGSSATGWTSSYTSTSGSGTPTVSSVGGAVQASATFAGAGSVTMTKTVSVTGLGTQPYIPVDWKSTQSGYVSGSTLTGSGGSVTFDKIAEGPSPTAGYTRAYFKAPAGTTSVTDLRLTVNTTGAFALSLTYTLSIDNVDKSDTPPSSGTRRQLFRTIPVSGSTRTQATVAVEHETSALGDVLVYCWPDQGNGYIPALRPFWASGPTVTSDTSLVSGGRSNLVGGATVYEVPANSLISGGHLLMVRLGGASTTATVTWTATTVINGTDTGPTKTGTRAIPITTAYQIFPLTRLILPTRDLAAASTALVRLSFTATVSSGSTANIDEGWVFSDEGQLVQVACGTATPAAGGSSNRLWINPATATLPRPTIRVGYAADGSDAAHPLSVLSWEAPQLSAPSSNVFTVATNALDVAVTLRHYPHWHTHAAS